MLRVFRDRGPWSEEQLDKLLSAYLDDDLAADERAGLEAQLDRDPALRERLEGLRMTVGALAALPPVEVPRNFILSPAMVSVPKPATRARRRRIWPVFGWATAAATLLLVLIFAGDVFLVNPAPRSEPVDVVALVSQPSDKMSASAPTELAESALTEANVTVQAEKEAGLPAEDAVAEKSEPVTESAAEPPLAAAPLPEEAPMGATQVPPAIAEEPGFGEAVSAAQAITATESEEADRAVLAPSPTPETLPTLEPEATPSPLSVAARSEEEKAAPVDEDVEQEESGGAPRWLPAVEVGLLGLVMGLALATLVIRRREIKR